MPSFRTVRRVPFTPRQMFDLVADVDKYPQFLPLCEALTVVGRQAEGDRDVVIAQMTVGYMAIRETFTSRVVLDPANLRVEAGAMPGAASGPFRRLENRWRFRPVTERACEVEFFLMYEFQSRTLGMIMGAMFEHVFRRFADAFEQRADQIYGRAAQA
jgi:coenzyme Q-binding protein COQ10